MVSELLFRVEVITSKPTIVAGQFIVMREKGVYKLKKKQTGQVILRNRKFKKREKANRYPQNSSTT